MTAERFSSTAALRIAACLAALAVVGCNVSDAGNVPCADDSSCPSDYPVCQAGKCVAGTPTDSNSVQIVTVGGVAAASAPPQRGTIHIGVLAKASSGVSSVALTAGSVAATLTTGASAPTPPLYDFTLDTTKVDMTTVAGVMSTLTATVTGGDKTTATASATITVDNVAPTLTGPGGAALAVNTQSALVGTLVYVDVVSNETLATLTGQVQQGSSVPFPMVEIPSGTSGVQRLSFTANLSTPPGAYSISITATDPAGNSATFPTTSGSLSFALGQSISASMTLTAHTDGSGSPVLINGLPAATNGDVVTTNLVVTPTSVALASGFPQFTVTTPAHTTVQATTDANGNGTFQVSSNSASTDGIYTFNALVQSADGALANATSQFVVARVPPHVVGAAAGISITPPYAGPNSTAVSVQFSTDSTPVTKSVTVNGHAATLVQTTGDSFAFEYTLSASAGDFPTTPSVVTVPVVVDIQDALGNDSNYSGLTATVDNLPPVVQTAVAAGTAVNAANATVQLTFTLRDVGGKVGANPAVTVLPGGIGSGSAATFVSRNDVGDTSSFVYQYVVKTADKEGLASVKIVGTDAALNQLTTTQTGVFTIDRTPPAFSGLALDHTVQKAGGTVTATVSVLECNPAGAPTIAFVNNSNGTSVDSGSMTTTGAAPTCNTSTTYTFTHTVGSSSVETNGGQVTATITSVDLAGNGTTQSISYTVDDTAPALLASSSFSPATNNTGTTRFTLVASKPLSSATSVQVNNGTTTFSNGQPNGSNTVVIAPDSSTTFPCTSCVFDISGLAPSGNSMVTWHAVANMVDTVPTPNTASATSTAAYVVDKTLPSANSFAVSPGIVRAGQQVTITGTATKALSGVAITTSNSDASSQACSFNASNNFTCLVTVADASNEVVTASVVLTDSVGNVSAGISAGSYTVDNTAPTISAVTVGTGNSVPVTAYAYFKKAATVSVEVDAIDCNLKSVAVAASYISTSSGQPVSAAMTLVNTPGSVGCSTTTKYLFQRAVAADEPNGSTSLSVQATDQAGNVTVGAAQYTVDNVAPTLSSTSFFQPTTVYTTNTTTGTDTFTLNASEPLGAVTLAVVSTDNPTISVGSIAIALSGTTPFPCNPCVYNITNLGRPNHIDTWGIQVTAAADRAGNSVASLPTTLSAQLTDDGVSTAFTLNNIVTSASYFQSTISKPATVLVTGVSNRALSAVSLNTINLSAGGASGDTSSCSFTNVGNQANVTCIITVSNTEGARAQLSGGMTDINSNAGTFTATAYTVDDTAPAIGTPTITGGGVLPGLQPVFSNIGGYTNLALSVPVKDCDTSTTVTVTAVDANNTPYTFNAGSSTAPSCSTNGTFPFTHAVSGTEANGVTTVTITAVDRAGNTSSASTTYNVDQVSPSVVDVAFTSASTGNTITTGNTGGFVATVTFSEPVIITPPGGSSLPANASSLEFSDGNGNTYLSNHTTNAIKPTVALSSQSVPFATSPSPSPASNNPAGSYYCTVCVFNVSSLIPNASSSPATAITFSAKLNSAVTDFAGNPLTTSIPGGAPTYLGDISSPSLSSVSINSPVSYNSSPRGSVTVTATSSKTLQGAVVAVTGGTVVGSQDSGTCSLDAATQKIVTCSITLNDHENASVTKTATVTVTDLAGNTGTAAPTYVLNNQAINNFTITATPSTIAQNQTSILTGSITEGTGSVAAALASASVTITYGSGGSGVGACSVSGQTYTCSVTSLNTTGSTSTDSVTVTVLDTAGNSGSKSGSITIDNRAAAIATVSGTSPASGLSVTPASIVTGAGTIPTLSWGALTANCSQSTPSNCYVSDLLGHKMFVCSNNAGNSVATNITSGNGCGGTTWTALDSAQSEVYTLTVTEVNGTTASATTSLAVAPSVTSALTADFGASSTATTLVTGGTGGYNGATGTAISFSAVVKGVNCAVASNNCVLTSSDGSFPSTKVACSSAFSSNTCTLTNVGPAGGTKVPIGGATYVLTVTDANNVSTTTSTTVDGVAPPTGTMTCPTNVTDQTNFSIAYTVAGTTCSGGSTCAISYTNASAGMTTVNPSSSPATITGSTVANDTLTTYTLALKNSVAAGQALDTAGSVASAATCNVTMVAAPTISTALTADFGTSSTATTLVTGGNAGTPISFSAVVKNVNCSGSTSGNSSCVLTSSDGNFTTAGLTCSTLVGSTCTLTNVVPNTRVPATGSATTYTLTVTNSAGTVVASPSTTSVTGVAAPTASITSCPTYATNGNSFNIAYTITSNSCSGSNCTISYTNASSTTTKVNATSAGSPVSITGSTVATSATTAFTLNVVNSAALANALDTAGTVTPAPTCSVTTVATPTISAGSFTGPTVVSENATLTLSLPSTYNTPSPTAYVQVSGANVTGDIHSSTSVVLATPNSTTIYSLVAFNEAGTSAALGSVTVHVASSTSEDSLPSALYGAAATVIGGSGTNAANILITGGAATAITPGSAPPAGSTATYIYNTTTNAITAGPTMSFPRAFHTATAMGNGTVLIFGGNTDNNTANTAELYTDGASPPIAPIGSDQNSHCMHSAALLDSTNGVVGIFGGFDCGPTTTTYNPSSNILLVFPGLSGANVVQLAMNSNGSAQVALSAARAAAAAVVLGASNAVAVAGGYSNGAGSTIVGTADLFTYGYVSAHPERSLGASASTPTVTLAKARSGLTATMFSAATCAGTNGNPCKALFAGGSGDKSAEVFTLNGSGGVSVATTGNMNVQRQFQAAALLNANGFVFLAGGASAGNGLTTEVYDWTTGNFWPAASMALSRQQFSAFEIATSPYKVGLFGGATANSGSTSSPTVVEVESITP